MVRDMDTNADRIITPEEFIAYRARQFDPLDKDENGFLDAKEFSRAAAFRNGDKNKDGKLARAEYLNIFRSQFPNVDVNGDGVINAKDSKNDNARKAARKASETPMGTLRKNDRIVFLGDSITAAGVRPTGYITHCLLYTSPSPRDQRGSRMPSSA